MNERRVQPVEVVLQVQPDTLERNGEVRRKLAGKMKHATPAPIDPVNLMPIP